MRRVTQFMCLIPFLTTAAFGQQCEITCEPGCSVACCDANDVCCSADVEPWSLWDEVAPCSCISVGGWTQVGYHTQSTRMFNSRPHDVQLHQQWLYIEREADGSQGLDWGFRFDTVYGTDGPDTQAFSNRSDVWDEGWDHGADYGWAIPQTYLQLAAGDLSIIAGHFFTLVGYEVVTAPDNFFYSHAYTMYNSEPFTHTGVLGTYSVSDNLEVYGGWVAGWDTAFDRNEGSQFIGGASLAVTDSTTITYIFLLGEAGLAGTLAAPGNPGLPGAYGYNHSIVISTDVTDRLTYVIQSDLVEYNDVDAGAALGLPPGINIADFRTIGINQYLLYDVTDRIAAGMRLEWWHTDRSSSVTPNDEADVAALTMGLNIKPHSNLIIRPEVRWDWNHDGVLSPTATPRSGDGSFGVDMILTY